MTGNEGPCVTWFINPLGWAYNRVLSYTNINKGLYCYFIFKFSNLVIGLKLKFVNTILLFSI